jgi:DNA-binding transcriptional LysR family regulator
MHEMNLTSLDLNLVRVFLAIWDARSLTDAGERLHLTQPAVSHALRRLRDEFEDPLFVRVSNAMVPTDAATRLESPLRQALGIIHRAVHEHSAFEPTRAVRVFRLAMSDVSEFVLLPRLLAELERSAPGVRLESVRVDPATISAQLRTGEVDLALGYLPGLEEGCVSDLLTLDTFVCLVRAEHPLANVELTARTFSELRFVHARLGGATGHQMVERWLDTHGVERTVALRLAHFTIAPEIVRQTDLAVIFPRNMAERVNHAGAFRLLSLPFETLSVEVKVHTHSHFASDLGIRWLRDTLIKQWSTVANAIEVPSNKTAHANIRGDRSP